jgi:hypothetical protein
VRIDVQTSRLADDNGPIAALSGTLPNLDLDIALPKSVRAVYLTVFTGADETKVTSLDTMEGTFCVTLTTAAERPTVKVCDPLAAPVVLRYRDL